MWKFNFLFHFHYAIRFWKVTVVETSRSNQIMILFTNKTILFYHFKSSRWIRESLPRYGVFLFHFFQCLHFWQRLKYFLRGNSVSSIFLLLLSSSSSSLSLSLSLLFNTWFQGGESDSDMSTVGDVKGTKKHFKEKFSEMFKKDAQSKNST